MDIEGYLALMLHQYQILFLILLTQEIFSHLSHASIVVKMLIRHMKNKTTSKNARMALFGRGIHSGNR